MKKLTKRGVLKEIEKNGEEIKGFGVKRIGLFGSVLRGKHNGKSDIDILVDFKEPSFDNYANTLILLEKIFKKKIDLVTRSSLRPELDYIKKEAEYARI